MFLKIPISIIFLFVLFKANAQIDIQFTSNKQSGCVPLLINFTNNSTPSENATYYWSFGNGNYSTLKNPQAAYIQAGKYSVQLIVTVNNQSDTLLYENYITVFPKPISNFTNSGTTEGCLPLNIQFQDLSISENPIIEYIWDFGDGNMSFESNPNTTYEKAGFHTVSLRIVDENTCENSIFKNNYIKAVEKPKINFSSSHNFNCNPPSTIQFSDETVDIYNMSYNWNFGDGNISTEKSPNHTYDTNGIFDVELIVKNEHNCSDTLLKSNFIEIGDIKSNFSISTNKICINDTVKFYNLSLNATEFVWDFGDGIKSDSINDFHVYSKSGTYNVSLTAKNGELCSDIFTRTIIVDYLKADFTTDKNFACTDSVLIEFTDKSENAVTWEWHFGNGKSAFGKNQKIYFNSNENSYIEFSDTLIISNINGCKNMIIKEKDVVILKPIAFCTPNNSVSHNIKTKGCYPLTIDFQDKSIYNTQKDYIVNRYWDFGDNSNSTNVQNISHVYNKVGEYDASLKITTNLGCTSSFNVKVLVGEKQKPNFYVEGIDSMCANYEFHFRSNSSDENLIDEYLWVFSDGRSEFLKNVNHKFLDTGYCDASLKVAYYGCWSDFITKNKIVYTSGALGTFTPKPNCENPQNYDFETKIIDATKWYWNWGDGTVDHSMSENPTHNYAESGDYNVTLVSLNENNDCMFVDEKSVRVRNATSTFTVDQTIGCKATQVKLNPDLSRDVYPNFVDNGYVYKYKWIFPENSVTKYSDSEISYKFNNPGVNSVKLVVTDINGCTDTSSKFVKIYDSQPNFKSDKITGCTPLSINFENLTVSDTTIASYKWNFGDGLISTLENPSHIFTKKNNYDISLIVTDVLSCKDTIKMSKFISPYKPQPKISISSNEICIGDTIYFNETEESNLIHTWNFGNNSTSNLANTQYIYTNKGTYDISLKVSDNTGCDSTIFLNNYINVFNYPNVDFVTDTTYSDCYPFLVKFSSLAQSEDSLSFSWNFGDGKTSFVENPTHSYTIPGDFDILFIAQNRVGCADSIVKNNYIHVGGPYAEIIKPETICKGISYPFTLKNKLNIFDFKWDMGDGTIKYGDTIHHSYQQYGKIYHSLILFSDTLSTCDKTIKDSIKIIEIIAGFTNSDKANCIYNPLKFNNISVGNFNNLWFIDSNYIEDLNPIFAFQKSGNMNIKLVVTGVDECKDSTEKNIMIHPLPKITANNDTMLCKGSDIQLIASGGVEYIWISNSDSIFENSPTVLPDFSSTYSVVGTDFYGCKNTDSSYIFVQQIPEIFASNDTSIIIGEFVTLRAASDQIVNYEWTSDADLSCYNCQNPKTQILDDYLFQINISDTNSCFTVSKEFEIKIRKEYTLDLPTVFTPNNDGINEYILPRGWGIKEILEFTIYNKWGEIVYEYANDNKGWNGVYKGKIQESDTYVYFVRIKTFEDEVLSKKGNFNLLR